MAIFSKKINQLWEKYLDTSEKATFLDAASFLVKVTNESDVPLPNCAWQHNNNGRNALN